MESYQKSRAYRHFVQHSPRRPFATDTFPMRAEPMPKRAALELANIQVQPKDMRFSIAVDIDHEDAYVRIRENDFPPPQIITINPKSGRAHAIWQVAEGVGFGSNFQRKPQRAFLDLQRQVTLMNDGDPAYGHFMTKTPGHHRWETVINDIPPYSMAALFEAIPLGIARQARAQSERPAHYGGRHDTIWEIGRRWAYGEVKKFKRRSPSYEAWENHVYREFMALNTFAMPLTPNHIRSLARNVATYCWTNADRLNGSILDGEKRSLVKSWQREEISAGQRAERMEQGARYTHAVRRNKTFDAITGAIGQLAAQGIHSPSARQIAGLAGVSPRTVERFRASQGHMGTGN